MSNLCGIEFLEYNTRICKDPLLKFWAARFEQKIFQSACRESFSRLLKKCRFWQMRCTKILEQQLFLLGRVSHISIRQSTLRKASARRCKKKILLAIHWSPALQNCESLWQKT